MQHVQPQPQCLQIETLHSYHPLCTNQYYLSVFGIRYKLFKMIDTLMIHFRFQKHLQVHDLTLNGPITNHHRKDISVVPRFSHMLTARHRFVLI